MEVAYPFRNLRANTFGERVEMANTPRDAELVAMIRTEARRAYEETRRRLLSMRSHRALVLRFAQWVQLYGRNELYDLAKNTPGKVEDVLTQQLARFLFERGLNPLTKANVGPSQPDLLDPTTRWSFYVEAKQYNEAGRSVVKKAVRQIADTLLPLRALPNGIREAFLVVFRVGGPRLVLPPEVPVDGVRIWPVLVDIAPSSEANSHQKHTPIVVSLEELLAHDEQ
ncbi:hypothetical protein DB32_007174 [Sandaracinus amylolyticus]|uniref:Uncharacterized protein n=1 Tax=Sandaracinus amylolyticus TaxID=927083 RepID=A0A0F6W897_9BACT|nr:hypothetical protein DB32_007174 [Sandaracinus amylolyticus]